MKTPEELAHDYSSRYRNQLSRLLSATSYRAGYQAAAPQWISVKDRLPEVGCARVSDDVLLINKYGEMRVSCFVTWDGNISVEWGEAGDLSLENFTHWMPLPKPPTEE